MSLIQAVSANNTSAGGTTVVVTIASSTAGSCLTAFAGGYGWDVTGVTDNQSQSWSPAFTAIGNTESAACWVRPDTVAGVTTVTITYAASHIVRGCVLEESGMLTASPVDAVALTPLNTWSSGATWTSATTGTTSQAQEVAYCIACSAEGSDRTLALDSASTTAGWAAVTGTGFSGGRLAPIASSVDSFLARRELSATGTYSCSGTNVDPGTLQMAVVTLKMALTRGGLTTLGVG
jgi:hypothetical protein